jgi:hypothetical protein
VERGARAAFQRPLIAKSAGRHARIAFARDGVVEGCPIALYRTIQMHQNRLRIVRGDLDRCHLRPVEAEPPGRARAEGIGRVEDQRR